MAMIALSSAVLAALAASERSLDRLFFAAAALCVLAGVLLLIVADLERALLLAAILAAAIVGASKVKFHHSGIKLTVADFALAFAGTIQFLVAQYRRAAMAVLAGGLALIVAALATLVQAGGPPLPLELRALLFTVALGACAWAYRASGSSQSFRRTTTQLKSPKRLS